MILDAQTKLIEFFPRVAKVSREVAEDCVSDGLLDFITSYDATEIRHAMKLAGLRRDIVILMRLKKFAERQLGRHRRVTTKFVSDDTPIGEDGDDLYLRDLFVPRVNSAERVENYAEWMMFCRKGDCPFTEDEIKALFGIIPLECK